MSSDDAQIFTSLLYEARDQSSQLGNSLSNDLSRAESTEGRSLRNDPTIVKRQVQHQSQISSSHSLSVQRESQLFFDLKQLTMEKSLSIDHIRVSLEEVQQDAVVQEAIQSAVYQINEVLITSRAKFRLSDDPTFYDMCIANKKGERKSLPALSPLERFSKFAKYNLVLVPNDIPSIIKSIKKQESRRTNIIVAEQMIEEVPEPGDYPKVENDEKQKAYMSFGDPKQQKQPQQQTHPMKSHRKSIQSTITPNSRTGTKEQDDSHRSIEKSSKRSIDCFPFSCCIGKKEQTPQKIRAPLLSK